MTAPKTPARHLLGLRDLPGADWRGLLDAAEVLAGPRGREPLLAGRRAASVFFNPSLRTRVSFEVACLDLGGHAVDLEVGSRLWHMETGEGVVMDGTAAEHVKEAFAVLSQMSDLVGLRAFAGLRDVAEDAADGTLHAAAAASSVPLLSLESAFDHPHQGLADALTVRRQFGGERVKVVITWAPHVRALPMAVPNAALVALAREGHDVVLCHPAGFDLAEAVVEHARGAARAAGGRVSVAHEREDALEGARVVYAKSWGASELYDDPEAGVAAVQAHPAWIVGAETMSATDNGIFMHCLPVRRGVVVADEVLDGDRSRVIPQAAARLDVQKATLCWALGVQP